MTSSRMCPQAANKKKGSSFKSFSTLTGPAKVGAVKEMDAGLRGMISY